jgi:hypothetical protein
MKAGILEKEDAAIARQQGIKHVSAATNQHETTEELLGAVAAATVSADWVALTSLWEAPTELTFILVPDLLVILCTKQSVPCAW